MLSGAIMLDRPIRSTSNCQKTTKICPDLCDRCGNLCCLSPLLGARFQIKQLAINLVNGEAEYHLWFLYLISTLYFLTPLLSGVRH